MSTDTVLEGIILRTFASGESDLVIRVLIETGEKIALFARRARQSKGRFGASCDTFDRGRVEYRPGRGELNILSSFSPITSYPEIRRDLAKVSAAIFLCEVFDLLIPEHLKEESATYEILCLGLSGITEATDAKEVLRSCFLTLEGLLRILGILPEDGERTPSAKNLAQLCEFVEHHSERRLESKQTIFQLAQSLKAA